MAQTTWSDYVSASVTKGYRHFLYGGKPGVAEELRTELTRRFSRTPDRGDVLLRRSGRLNAEEEGRPSRQQLETFAGGRVVVRPEYAETGAIYGRVFPAHGR